MPDKDNQSPFNAGRKSFVLKDDFTFTDLGSDTLYI